MNKRSKAALVVAACGLYFLLRTSILIDRQVISIGNGIFAKVSLVAEILLVLFIGVASYQGSIPKVLGLLIGSVLIVDALTPITHCITLLYINVILSSSLILFCVAHILKDINACVKRSKCDEKEKK